MTLKPVGLKEFSDLGLTHVGVTVRKPGSEQEKSFTATFLVDTGVMNSMVSSSELTRVGIQPVGKQKYELANGELVEYHYGIAQMSFLDEVIAVTVLFGAEDTEPILGSLALQSAGFLVDRKNQRVTKMWARPLKAVA